MEFLGKIVAAKWNGAGRPHDPLKSAGLLRGPAQRSRPTNATCTTTPGDSPSWRVLAVADRTLFAQVIDNLNASIHLRALLTDLFVVDEALKPPKARG